MAKYHPGTNNKKESAMVIWMPLLLGIALAVGLVAGASLDGDAPAIQFKEKVGAQRSVGQELEEILRFVDYKYVDKLDVDSFSENVLKSVLNKLDPHSSYISERELQQYNEQAEGSYKGIGVEFAVIDDTVRVVGLVNGNSPAGEAGIEPGDRIIAVDGRSVSGAGLSMDTITKYLRGDELDPVADLDILTFAGNMLKKFSLTRSQIEVNSVVGNFMLNGEVAYLRLDKFTASSYREFMEALESLFTKNEKAKHLVLDLRGNPGGYLDEAVKIASQFFKEKDKMIVFTKGHHAERKEYKTPGKVFFDIGKVMILMDQNSASGSEVVAGAVQDWDRGLVIGEPSYGKGLVQEQYELSEGGAIRLTTARYYTPSGRLIQKPYKSQISAKSDDNGSDSSSVSANSEYQTMIRKREVFGGGGIRPDIGVAQINTVPFWSSNNIQETIFYFFRDNFNVIESASDETELGASLNHSDVGLENYLPADLAKWYNDQDQEQQLRIRRQLIAEIIRMKFGEKGKWRYLSVNDNTIAEALRMMDVEDPFQLSAIK